MKKLLLLFGLVGLMACNQNDLNPGGPDHSGKIRFVAGGPAVTATVSTKATAVSATDLNTNGFKVNAVAGSAGADTEVWSNILFEKVEDAWEQDKWWPNSDGLYRFYATYPTSYAMTFAAGGPTISASNEHDIICAYKGDATYKSVNTLAFDHIFARLSTVTVSMVSPYTISNMSIMITPKVSGTYNLYTGAGQADGTGWSSTVEGSATNIATAAFAAGVSTTSNDIYLVPGTYTLSATWTATKDNYTQTFTNKTVTVDLVAGKTNNITASLTGDGTEIQFNVSVTAWSDNAVAAGTFPVTDPVPAQAAHSFAGLMLAPEPLLCNYPDDISSFEIRGIGGHKFIEMLSDGIHWDEIGGSGYYDSNEDWVEVYPQHLYADYYQLASYFDTTNRDWMADRATGANIYPGISSVQNGISYDGYNDWRLPTRAELMSILGVNSAREGSTFITIEDTYEHCKVFKLVFGDDNGWGFLVFPDGETITTTWEYPYIEQEEDDYPTWYFGNVNDVGDLSQDFLDQGCVFIPCGGIATYSNEYSDENWDLDPKLEGKWQYILSTRDVLDETHNSLYPAYYHWPDFEYLDATTSYLMTYLVRSL